MLDRALTREILLAIETDESAPRAPIQLNVPVIIKRKSFTTSIF